MVDAADEEADEQLLQMRRHILVGDSANSKGRVSRGAYCSC